MPAPPLGCLPTGQRLTGGHAQAVASKAARLKQLLPETDVSALVSAWPDLVLRVDLDAVERRLAELRWAGRCVHGLVAAPAPGSACLRARTCTSVVQAHVARAALVCAG